MGTRLSNTESFMWSLGQDPNLASTMGMMSILEGMPEPDRTRAVITNLVASVERLRVKISDPLGLGGSISPLEWVPDDQFDLDYHLRTSRMFDGPVAPDDPRLKRMATLFVNDPFDRTRPLWQFLFVDGLADGRAAMLSKFHHSISDGTGMMRLAMHLLEFEADAPPPEPADLDAVFEAEVAADSHEPNPLKAGAERVLDLFQEAIRDIPTPGRLWGLGSDTLASAKAAGLKPDFWFGAEYESAAPLWGNRSRNRRFAFLSESLEAVKDAARAHDVSVNDLFVGACAEAAVRYHAEHDIDIDQVRATVVINTKPDEDASADPTDLGRGDNTFLPVPLELPGTQTSAEERLAVIRSQVKKKRAMLEGKSGALESLSSLGTFVPPALAASLMIGQAARVDFATSNVPGAPIPTWFAGKAVEHMYPIGPVTGTAFNITMLSYNDVCDFGLHIDPAAVADSELLVKSIGLSFRELGVGRV